ncbi:MAG: hypothetical protein U9N54_09805 [candidate division Zixibacteria bacterium]|nr:hypothetical protein [candidate division Zixibacteria bacterium]
MHCKTGKIIVLIVLFHIFLILFVQSSFGQNIVVIDPGHGGTDPGSSAVYYNDTLM